MLEPFLQYSNPYQVRNARIDAFIVQSHAAALLERLVKHVQVSGRSALCEFISESLDSLNEEFEPFWDTSFGRAQRCLEAEDIAATDALCLIALRIAQFGAQGMCTGTFSQPHKVRWKDWLLPAMDEYSLAAEGSRLRLTGSLQGRQAFVLEQNDEMTSINECRDRDWKQLNRAAGLLLLSGDSILDDVVLEDEFHSIFSYPEIDQGIIDEFSRGLTVLQAVPEYESWVRRVVRGIVVCQTVHSRTRSSSWSEAPGLVLISRSDRDYLLAEMLVHEASHQYYNLVSRCGNILTGTDTRLFYSPAVERPRPLNKVLLGYHAFANFFLFYSQYQYVAGKDTADVQRILDMLAEKLPFFEQPLLETNGLSEIGQALFQPLHKKVCEALA